MNFPASTINKGSPINKAARTNKANKTNTGDSDTLAIISLGSNLGVASGPGSMPPQRTVCAALDELQFLSAQPIQISSLYRTSAVDCLPDAPDFINAVALLQLPSDLSALALLEYLHKIEARFGRTRHAGLNSPRTLDLDLISFGDLQSSAPELILPHPRARQRLFVLIPLVEVAPNLKLPGEELTVAELAAQLMAQQQDGQRVCRLPV